jgi:hypothetical protein
MPNRRNVKDFFSDNRNHITSTSLRWLRWTWAVVFLLVLAVWVAGIPARFGELSTDPYGFGPALTILGFSVRDFSAYATTLDASVMLAFILIGALVFWLKSSDYNAIIFSLVLILMPVVLIPLSPSIYKIHPIWRSPILLVRSIAGVMAINLFYIFPIWPYHVNGSFFHSTFDRRFDIALSIVGYRSLAAPYPGLYHSYLDPGDMLFWRGHFATIGFSSFLAGYFSSRDCCINSDDCFVIYSVEAPYPGSYRPAFLPSPL